MTVTQKILVAGLLFFTWGFFAFTGKVPVADFIAAIRDALIAIGVFHATISNPKG
jgi:hypothetical protein